jgi:FixJ family two-component response regulator
MDAGIFVLEDDDDLRVVLVDLIKRSTGRECVGLRTLGDLRDQRAVVLRCALGVLDVNLGTGQPSGLDAFAWLRAERFAGRIAFLTGHAATHPLVERARQMGEAVVLPKPLQMKQLIELLS